jgi:hypothetical protein
MGTFASALPDYQKVEIMMFTVGYIPTTQGNEKLQVNDAYLQKVLLKTLQQVQFFSNLIATVFFRLLPNFEPST